MKAITEFKETIHFVLTDIDVTLTDDGQLASGAYHGMWKLNKTGIQVIPVTGRPAGWCEMIARMWPVAGIIGENGGFYFCYDHKQKKMLRHFVLNEKERAENKSKLKDLEKKILTEVNGSALASDQFCRLMDLAIDFCEDVTPLPKNEAQKIVQIFNAAGAQAKMSSIHVNGWFGNYDKLSQSLRFLSDHFQLTPEQAKKQCLFIGDSPNDEPMWEFFKNGVAVANIQNFLQDLKSKPNYICSQRGGAGFTEMAEVIWQNKNSDCRQY